MGGSSFSVQGLQWLYKRCEGLGVHRQFPGKGSGWVWCRLGSQTGGLASRGVIVAAGGPKEPDRL